MFALNTRVLIKTLYIDYAKDFTATYHENPFFEVVKYGFVGSLLQRTTAFFG